MFVIEVLELEIERRVDDYRYVLRRWRCRSPIVVCVALVRCLAVAAAKLLLELQGDLSELLHVLGIKPLHADREIQDVAACATTEALPDAVIELRGERRRLFLALVGWQRTKALVAIAFSLDLYAVE